MGFFSVSEDQSRLQPTIPRNDLDRALLNAAKNLPGDVTVPCVSEADLSSIWADNGYPQEEWSQLTAKHDAYMNEIAATHSNTIQAKPAPNDFKDVQLFKLPNSDFAIRMWGNMNTFGHFAIDYFNTATHQPVDLPEEYKIKPLPIKDNSDRAFTGHQGHLISLDETFQVLREERKPGQEVFLVHENTYWELTGPDIKPFCFYIPLISPDFAGLNIHTAVPYVIG